MYTAVCTFEVLKYVGRNEHCSLRLHKSEDQHSFKVIGTYRSFALQSNLKLLSSCVTDNKKMSMGPTS